MNVARLNFSHGTQAEHKVVLDHLRELSRDLKAPVAILQDLQGPKVRVGRVEQDQVELRAGDPITIATDGRVGTARRISCDFKELPRCCQPGMQVFLDDGLLEFKVVEVKSDEVDCEVVLGGVLKSRKGINLPGSSVVHGVPDSKGLGRFKFWIEK